MRWVKPGLILAGTLPLMGCDHFLEVYYVPEAWTPEVPGDANKMVAELHAFGAKYGMDCRDNADVPEPHTLAICGGIITRNIYPKKIYASYRVVVYAGHPQFEYFEVGSGPSLRSTDCEYSQAVQEALEEFTGPLKIDAGSDPCPLQAGNVSHG